MKKSLKVMFLSFVCLFCLLLNTGCGCDRPISVKYVVSVIARMKGISEEENSISSWP